MVAEVDKEKGGIGLTLLAKLEATPRSAGAAVEVAERTPRRPEERPPRRGGDRDRGGGRRR